MNNNKFYFENLEVYQRALRFVNNVYDETKGWPKEYLFSLTDQLRRASASIALNIAEGASRTTPDFKRFITISRSSCHECVPIIEIAFEQKLINSKIKDEWLNELVVLSKMLNRLRINLKPITHNL